MRKARGSKAPENAKNVLNINNIKEEIFSDDEIDDNAYYVVVIDEENGEKVVKAIKVENVDDPIKFAAQIKRERFDLRDDNEAMDAEDHDANEVAEDTSHLEENMEEIHGSANEEQDSEPTEMPVQAIITEESDTTDMDESRLNLIQVLSGNEPDSNVIQYGDGMSLVGEVITGDLSVDTTEFTHQEVVVGDMDGEYHIITADGEIAFLGDDEETITVMQQEDGSFLCDCGEAYMDFGDYENHIKVHNTYKCSMCDKCFESNEILTGHMLLHSTSESLVQCPFCYQSVKRGLLTTHIKLNHNHTRHYCNICKKSFATEANLKRHLQTHNTTKKFECNICFKGFMQKNAMETHRLSHEDALLKCALCPQEFDTEEECLQHQREGCIFPPSEEKTHDKPHVCEMCGKSYASPHTLKSHIESVHGNQATEILCSECGEVLPNRKAMHTHSLTHKHSRVKNPKRFACGTCGKGCASHAMLLMHERVHTNERPFPCPKCPLAFKTKTHMSTHQLTHTQEKRFGCSVCMKFFALKGNLVVHLRTHTGERPYVCSICNQGFIDSKYLKKHKQKRHDIANIPWNQYY